MFEFKKAMQNIMEKEDYECECCGSMDDKTKGASGCSSGCGSGMSSCCGPVENSNENSPKSEGTGCQSSCTGK